MLCYIILSQVLNIFVKYMIPPNISSGFISSLFSHVSFLYSFELTFILPIFPNPVSILFIYYDKYFLFKVRFVQLLIVSVFLL